MAKATQFDTALPLREGLDYTVEAGRWVFTAHFHLKRGYCCGSGCRHCPYNNDDAGKDRSPAQIARGDSHDDE